MMKLYAIADLHLPGGEDKPMNRFGSHWDNHFARISEDWRQRVREEDTVLIPGDISWAMQVENALPDLESIGALPGRKVLLRGNHDYWWPSIQRLRELIRPWRMDAIQNDALDLGDVVVCGTRGWMLPVPENPLSAENEKIYRRELLRLEMSLQRAAELAKGRPVVAMTHYPPLLRYWRDTEPAAMLSRWGTAAVVYGHLHGEAIREGFSGVHGGVRYCLTSCDSLGFRLQEIDWRSESGLGETNY